MPKAMFSEEKRRERDSFEVVELSGKHLKRNVAVSSCISIAYEFRSVLCSAASFP